MPHKRNQNQKAVERTAKNIKDGADTAFDSVENAIEATESTAMNAVDKTADAINKQIERNKSE
ncbi:hypothetical protein [Bacillus sp. Marseille-Q3570]|uniref:hypothetical protein n=1 Tax=Bacillus sp. Marseille-Q3570 TaxID=2963522 RepID=UPI0021B79E74|nr:hypothetical protein [Bacillus sp. Marseille-Q3570]